MNSKINNIYLILSSIGAFISIYLWNAHVTTSEVICSTGCEQVISGPYGELFGVPWGAYGMAFYALVVLVTFLRMQIDHILLDRLMGVVILGGVGATLYLRYLEFFKIGEICAWCWGSALVVLAMVVTYILQMRGRKDDLLGKKK